MTAAVETIEPMKARKKKESEAGKLSDVEQKAKELLSKYREKEIMLKEKADEAVKEFEETLEELKKPVKEEKEVKEPVEKERVIKKKRELMVELQKKKDEIVASNKRITTVFDTLLKIVTEAGEISLKDAARQIGMDERAAEEDARLLEGTGLIEIIYPPFGEIKLKKAEVKEF